MGVFDVQRRFRGDQAPHLLGVAAGGRVMQRRPASAVRRCDVGLLVEQKLDDFDGVRVFGALGRHHQGRPARALGRDGEDLPAVPTRQISEAPDSQAPSD